MEYIFNLLCFLEHSMNFKLIEKRFKIPKNMLAYLFFWATIFIVFKLIGFHFSFLGE